MFCGRCIREVEASKDKYKEVSERKQAEELDWIGRYGEEQWYMQCAGRGCEEITTVTHTEAGKNWIQDPMCGKCMKE